jgi:hypothetical protein
MVDPHILQNRPKFIQMDINIHLDEKYYGSLMSCTPLVYHQISMGSSSCRESSFIDCPSDIASLLNLEEERSKVLQ